MMLHVTPCRYDSVYGSKMNLRANMIRHAAQAYRQPWMRYSGLYNSNPVDERRERESKSTRDWKLRRPCGSIHSVRSWWVSALIRLPSWVWFELICVTRNVDLSRAGGSSRSVWCSLSHLGGCVDLVDARSDVRVDGSTYADGDFSRAFYRIPIMCVRSHLQTISEVTQCCAAQWLLWRLRCQRTSTTRREHGWLEWKFQLSS